MVWIPYSKAQRIKPLPSQLPFLSMKVQHFKDYKAKNEVVITKNGGQKGSFNSICCNVNI